MAAPTTVARVPPTGIRLDNGFKTLIAFSRAPNICIWEKTVKPSGRDGGEEIPTSTMHNIRHHTAAPRALVRNTPSVLKVAYDPNDRATIENTLLNQPGSVTEHFPDGTTYDYWGFLRSIEYDPLEEGRQPEATVTIAVTNYDPVNRVEAGPVLTNVAGT